MKTYFLKYLSIIFCFTIMACSKHAGDSAESNNLASLTISMPVTNQIIPATDSVHVYATAIATAVMHGYDVFLTKANDTAKIAVISIHDHNDTLVINRKFAPQPSGSYEAHIVLKLDHDGNTLHKMAPFTSQ